MDSYHFHFERMSNLDLHPLSLPVSRLSPAKSSSSIDQYQYTHHHSTGDSAYSSFSAGSTAPDYPSPFLLDELQSQNLHYSDLKCTKPKYSPTGLDLNSKSMDHIYRSMETVPQQHRRSSADFSNMGNPSVRMRPLPPPPPPSRLNSFITTRNLENSRARQSPEGQLADVSAPQQPSKPEVSGVRTEPVLGCAFPQLKDHLKQDPDKMLDPTKAADILNRSALPSGQAEHAQQPWSGRAEHQRKRSHSAYGGPVSEHQCPVSSRHIPQNMISGSIQHKGQFYFVTGVFKSSEPLQGVDEGAIVETSREWSCKAQRRRQSCPDGPSGKLFYQEEHKFSVQSEVVEHTSEGVEEQRTISRETARHHSTSNPIFYCGPDDTSVGAIITPALIKEDHTSHPKKEEMTRVSQLDIPSDKISKEATPLLYHLTGANRAAYTDKSKSDCGKAIKSTECVKDKPTAETDGQTSPSGEDQQSETPKEQPNEFFYPCGTLDDSYKKYYKEKLKDAQSKVLRATSFKRRDLQLSLPQRFQQRADKPLSVVPAGSPSIDVRPNLDSPGPPEADKNYMRELDQEIDKIIEKEAEKPQNIAQPQVSRVGCRRRLTADQKKLSRSEPEKLHQLADAPAHMPCRSLGNEAEALLPDGDHGLVSARRKMFETRGRALSASHCSKSSLKHLQHKALVAYMERKTGQKAAEPQCPAAPAHRNSTAEHPSDCSSTHHPASTKPHRPLSAGQILDSLSSSVKYSQFLSGHRRQSSWREECRHAGGSGSMESLLDRPEHPVSSRTRSTSTPHALQVRKHLDEFSAVHNMAISSAERAVEEQTGARPGRSASVQDERRVPARASRGKSMEELGASVVWRPEPRSHSSEQLDQRLRQRSISDAGKRLGALHTQILRAGEHTHNSQPCPEIPLFNTSVTCSSSSTDEMHTAPHDPAHASEPAAAALAVSREQHQTEAQSSLSHGDTTDPAVCEAIHHSSPHTPRLAEPQNAAPAPSAEDEGLPVPAAAGTEERSLARAVRGEQEPEGNGPPLKLQWDLLVQDVVSADRSLARTLYPLADRKTALMLMEQLLSEDTLLMEEHYKNKLLTLQSTHSPEMLSPPPSVSECVLTQQREELCHTQLDLLDKKAADGTHRGALEESAGGAGRRPERGAAERGARRLSAGAGARALCARRAGALHTVRRRPGAGGESAALPVCPSGAGAERPQHCGRQHGPGRAAISGQPLPSAVQTEGGRQRLEGQPGPPGAHGVQLPVQAADGRTAAGVPALHPDHGLLTHPAEGPGGEAAFGRGAAGGVTQHCSSMRRTLSASALLHGCLRSLAPLQIASRSLSKLFKSAGMEYQKRE